MNVICYKSCKISPNLKFVWFNSCIHLSSQVAVTPKASKEKGAASTVELLDPAALSKTGSSSAANGAASSSAATGGDVDPDGARKCVAYFIVI